MVLIVKGNINLASLTYFLAGIFSAVLGLHIINLVVTPKIPIKSDSSYAKVGSNENSKFLIEENIKQTNLVEPSQSKIKNTKPAIQVCEALVNTDVEEPKVRFTFQIDKLQMHFPNQDLSSIPRHKLKEVLVTAAMDTSKNNTQRIESLAALKLLDESPLPVELVDLVISDLPRFIAENDSPSAVEALILIEDDVQEYQFSQLLELNQTEDVDIRMASIFAIANADPYRQNKHVFEALFQNDKSQMVRDMAYNILINEYSYEENIHL